MGIHFSKSGIESVKAGIPKLRNKIILSSASHGGKTSLARFFAAEGYQHITEGSLATPYFWKGTRTEWHHSEEKKKRELELISFMKSATGKVIQDGWYPIETGMDQTLSLIIITVELDDLKERALLRGDKHPEKYLLPSLEFSNSILKQVEKYTDSYLIVSNSNKDQIVLEFQEPDDLVLDIKVKQLEEKFQTEGSTKQQTAVSSVLTTPEIENNQANELTPQIANFFSRF